MSSSNATQWAGTMFFARAVTPVHVGVDQGLGAINLPTAREAITRHPLIPGSSFKGVLRDIAELNPPGDHAVAEGASNRWTAFGPLRDKASDYRGALMFSDARLLFLPVASLKGTFAWTTSRMVLRRYARDLAEVDPTSAAALPTWSGDDTLVSKDSALWIGHQRVSLREVLTKAAPHDDVTRIADHFAPSLWAEQDRAFFAQRVAVLPDAIFDALTRIAMEVRARVAIDSERGTAERSGPWTEEHIPAESILGGLVFGRRSTYFEPKGEGENAREVRRSFSAEQVLQVFTSLVGDGCTIRIGGHSSIGLGRVRITCKGA